MKEITLLAVIMLVAPTSFAQGTIFEGFQAHDGMLYLTSAQYNRISIDGKVSVRELLHDSSDVVPKKLGEPVKVEKRVTILDSSQILKYKGLEFLYSDASGTFEFSRVTIRDNINFLQIGDCKFRPGITIGELEKFLPEGYERKDKHKGAYYVYVGVTDGKGGVRMRNGKPMLSDVDRIRFSFDQSTGYITAIEVIRRLV